MDIYRAANRRVKYPPLVNDTQCPFSEWIWRISVLTLERPRGPHKFFGPKI